MNIELLQRVKRAILTHPKHFDMDSYSRVGYCGTTASIGGWAICLNANKPIKSSIEMNVLTGATALGVEIDDAFELFYVSGWHPDAKRAFFRARDNQDAKGMARAAGMAIDAFIERYTATKN